MNKWFSEICVVVIALTISSCSKSSQGADCIRGVGTIQSPCLTSFYSVAANPRQYNKMYVEFTAYYPGHGAAILYPSRDSAEADDFSMSFIMLDKIGFRIKDAGHIKLVSQFSFDRHDYVGGSYYRQAGSINKIVRVEKVMSLTERINSCVNAGCDLVYDQGVFPVRKLRKSSP
ncbi:hypothetical protein [Xanthomonas bonasiae]|uniref:hypothetical protein n=1 Tax=Xanthomonas bonasiae TaxID=2810351 RepID=UPI00177CC1D7|nr:hypothetical protein [Xanthomonas surreyensis]MBD7921437.1 hypothetical protein [Xanthomonas surreyensis]